MIFFFVFLLACGETRFTAARSGGLPPEHAKQLATKDDETTDDRGLDETLSDYKEVEFKITTHELIPTEKVHIFFVLDNSESMTEELARIKPAIRTLYAKLQDLRFAVSIRFLTLDKVHRLFTEKQFTISDMHNSPSEQTNFFLRDGLALKILGFSPLNFSTALRQNIYSSVKMFSNKTDDTNAISNELSQIGIQQFERELGIASFDMLNYLSFAANIDDSQKLGQSDNLHVVLLSDENNNDFGLSSNNVRDSIADELGTTLDKSYLYYNGQYDYSVALAQAQYDFSATKLCVKSENKNDPLSYGSPAQNRWYICEQKNGAYKLGTAIPRVGLNYCEFYYSTCNIVVDGNPRVVNGPINIHEAPSSSCQVDKGKSAVAFPPINLNPALLPWLVEDSCESANCPMVRETNYTYKSAMLSRDPCASGFELVDVAKFLLFSKNENEVDANIVLSNGTYKEKRLQNEIFTFSFSRQYTDVELKTLLTKITSVKDVSLMEILSRPSEASGEITGYTATPEGALSMMQTLHPSMKLVWHSIVNLDGIPCPGDQQNMVSMGIEYLQLSKATGGVTQSICSTDYSAFFDSLLGLIHSEVDTDYEFSESKTAIGKVINVTTGKELKTDVDFKVDGGKIKFTKHVISKGDLIRIYLL